VRDVSDWGPASGFQIELVVLDFNLPFETIEYIGGCRVGCLESLDSALAIRPCPQGKSPFLQRMLTGIDGNEMLLDASVEPAP